MKGLRVATLEEKISLYAGDTLLYLNDAGPLLLAAPKLFDTYRGFSFVHFNWSKSLLFFLDDDARDGNPLPATLGELIFNTCGYR